MRWFFYDVFHYLHVVGAIFAIGPYAVFFHVLRLMKQMENGGMVHGANLAVLRFVVWVSQHAGHVLVVSGVFLWWLGRFALWTSWIVIPVVILLAGLYFMARLLTHFGTIGARGAGRIYRHAKAACFPLGLSRHIAGLPLVYDRKTGTLVSFIRIR